MVSAAPPTRVPDGVMTLHERRNQHMHMHRHKYKHGHKMMHKEHKRELLLMAFPLSEVLSCQAKKEELLRGPGPS